MMLDAGIEEMQPEGAQEIALSLARERRHWVRAATLSNIRWVAIAGQFATVMVTQFGLGFDLPLWACLGAILASVWFNVIAATMMPSNARLSEQTALAWLIFDAVQLAILLALTGGLSNPFSILFLAPTTIAAAALTPRSSRIAVLACALLIVLVELLHLPLKEANGEALALPLMYRLGVGCALLVGVAFVAGYVRRVADEAFRMSQALSATQLALAREQQLSSLGAMAAAAAHELGTPLATIALAAREMERELTAGSEEAEDLALIREQTARCRDILAELSELRRRDMEHIKTAPLLSVLEEAAAPHQHLGKEVVFTFNGAPADADTTPSPEIERRPEVIHGLRNLVQNAVDFASSRVSIHARAEANRIEVRIEDDGKGFRSEALNRLGEPFISSRRGREAREGGYEGMGLGIFIAKTLLERRGAELAFFNRRKRGDQSGGATAQIIWRRDEFEVDRSR